MRVASALVRSSNQLLACSALLLLLPFAGCKKEAAPQVEVQVQAEHPEQGSIAERIEADAVLAPLAQAAITPKISAPVRRFLVQRGAHVKAGQLLAELESSDLAAAALDNKGSYMAAEAAYATATKAQLPEDALKAESDLAQARANLALNLSIVKSRKQLLAEGAIAGRDLDTAEAALVQAQAMYDAAAKHQESMHSVSHQAALKAAQGQLTSAEGKYKGAAAQAGYAEVRSPIEGVVTDRPLFAGEMAPAGVPLLTVMGTSFMIAKAHIAQTQAQRLKVGDPVQISVPGLEATVEAKVELISPALDPGSTTVEVWIKAANRGGAMKAGTPVKVSISGRSAANALKIPIKSVLVADDGSKSVLVMGADGLAHRKHITLGLEDGKNAQVLDGLAAADFVIAGGAYGLDEGTRVKTGPAEGDDKSKSGKEQ